MSRWILILLILGYCEESFSQCEMNVAGDSLIIWQEGRRLTYEDFKGTQDNAFLVYGYPANGAAATKIHALFEFDENENLKVTVTNEFFTYKSWIKIKKPDVLSHEQGHFDISEIFTRKIRNAVSVLVVAKIQNEQVYNSEVKKLLQDLKAYQDKYDLDTDHGFDSEKQIIWEKRITKGLEELKMFSK